MVDSAAGAQLLPASETKQAGAISRLIVILIIRENLVTDCKSGALTEVGEPTGGAAGAGIGLFPKEVTSHWIPWPVRVALG